MKANHKQRDLHEKTSEIIHRMRMLSILSRVAENAAQDAPEDIEVADAGLWARYYLDDLFGELELARAREWVGLGGKSTMVPADGERQ